MMRKTATIEVPYETTKDEIRVIVEYMRFDYPRVPYKIVRLMTPEQREQEMIKRFQSIDKQTKRTE